MGGSSSSSGDAQGDKLRKIQAKLQKTVFDFVFFPCRRPLLIWDCMILSQMRTAAHPRTARASLPFVGDLLWDQRQFSVANIPDFMLDQIEKSIENSRSTDEVAVRISEELIRNSLEQMIQLNQQRYRELYEHTTSSLKHQLKEMIHDIVEVKPLRVPDPPEDAKNFDQKQLEANNRLINAAKRLIGSRQELFGAEPVDKRMITPDRAASLNSPDPSKINVFASFENFYQPKLFSKTQTFLTQMPFPKLVSLMNKIQVLCRKYVIKDDTTVLNYKDSDSFVLIFFVDARMDPTRRSDCLSALGAGVVSCEAGAPVDAIKSASDQV